mmetsp:Transcript_10586/g.18139  ORF Transcript_10586/g.18139 Transcript_10586/m.18139 type:complete len:198 (-) Transcript_10586:128-721(-)
MPSHIFSLCLAACICCTAAFAFVTPASSIYTKTIVRNTDSNQMIFGFGGNKKEEAVSTGRPNLGVKATERKTVRKAAVTINNSAWTGPAVERRKQYLKEREAKKAASGTFTPQQMAAFTEARKKVPSNARNYWIKIASRVPGQTPETCKAMAQSVQYAKAAGEAQNYWGDVVEVREIEAVVDESADVMGRWFGAKKK